MPYLIRLKSFDPEFRPFLMTVTRAFYCWPEQQSDKMLADKNPIILYAGSVGEAVSLKLEIESAVLPDFLTTSSLDFQDAHWREAYRWRSLPKGCRACDIELDREIRYSLRLTSIERQFFKPVIAAIRLTTRLPLDVVSRYVKHPPSTLKVGLRLETAQAIQRYIEQGFYPSADALPELRNHDPDFWANPLSWPRPSEKCCSVELIEQPG